VFCPYGPPYVSVHTTKEDVRELIPHMGLISEVIIIISEQYNNHGKNDFL